MTLNSSPRRFGFCLLVGLVLASESGLTMPEDYKAEVTDLVSAEELNLLYGSIPHRRDIDKLTVLASFRQNYATKYYVLRLPHQHDPGRQDFIIASTSPRGCEIHYQGDEAPFTGDMSPLLKVPLPMTVLWNLYGLCTPPTREKGGQPLDSPAPKALGL